VNVVASEPKSHIVPPKVRPDIFGVIAKVCPISGFGKGIGIPVWTKHVIPFVVGNVRIHAYVTGVKSGTGPTLSGLAEIPRIIFRGRGYTGEAILVKGIKVNINHSLNDGKEVVVVCVCECRCHN
jgi:hypothetical protein